MLARWIGKRGPGQETRRENWDQTVKMSSVTK